MSAQAPSPDHAIALEKQGKLPEAEQEWHHWLAANPKDAGAYASLGVVLSKETKYAEAAKAYRRALALNHNLPGIQLNLGLAEFKQNKFQDAWRTPVPGAGTTICPSSN